MLPIQRRDSPTYPLGAIQEQVPKGEYFLALSARDSIRELGFSEGDVVRCICGLSEIPFERGGDVHKTMEADHPRARARGLWQDVYYVEYEHIQLYVKLQHPSGNLPVVISFKKNESMW